MLRCRNHDECACRGPKESLTESVVLALAPQFWCHYITARESDIVQRAEVHKQSFHSVQTLVNMTDMGALDKSLDDLIADQRKKQQASLIGRMSRCRASSCPSGPCRSRRSLLPSALNGRRGWRKSLRAAVAAVAGGAVAASAAARARRPPTSPSPSAAVWPRVAGCAMGDRSSGAGAHWDELQCTLQRCRCLTPWHPTAHTQGPRAGGGPVDRQPIEARQAALEGDARWGHDMFDGRRAGGPRRPDPRDPDSQGTKL